MSEDYKTRWANDAAKLLVGRKIVAVRYMTEAEVEELGWYGSAVVVILDNGLALFPSSDDEGNDAGALFTTDEKLSTIPVIGG